MVGEADHGGNEACRAEARHKVGPLLFGWGLLGTASTRRYLDAAGPEPLDLTATEDAGVLKMLHWLAHCGLGGSA